MDELKKPHWTSTTHGFVSKISGDFVLQVEEKLDKEGMSHADFAALLNVTESSVSQALNRPKNFKLSTLVEYVRVLGMKVAVVAYEDGDPTNERGPVNSEIFYRCWKNAGSPLDFFDLGPQAPAIALTSDQATTSGYERQELPVMKMKFASTH